MRIEESCGCGASLTFDYGDDEPPTVIDLQGIVDEFRHAHAQCRTDERARIVAEGYSRPSVELEAPWVWGTTEATDSVGVPWVGEQDEAGETAVGPPIAPPEPPTPGDILRTMLRVGGTTGDPARLRLLADWLDQRDADRRGAGHAVEADEVQRDLRRMADWIEWAEGVDAHVEAPA
jgi:hypothetical protein